ncbi:MAG: fibronectin type III domain-containing protein, partial [Anaerolineaceae bacterium]|nr:fibronectin type III domain-containing protein [Anaerolineaceae bacterium]
GDSGPSYLAEVTSLVCAPSDLDAVALNQKRIRITWQDSSPDEEGFQVERSPDGISGWQQVGVDLAPDTQSYEDAPLTCNIIYYYRVSAFNSVGSNPVSGANATTDTCAPPPQPGDLTVDPLSINSLMLAWTDIRDEEDSYEIWRSPDGSSGWLPVGTTDQDIVAFTDTRLERDTTYYYRVIAVNTYGNSTASADAPGTTYGFGYFSPLIFK